MKRTPEPELMQSPSQVRAYADADFSKSDSMVIKSLENYLTKVGKTLNKTDLIFDIACGPGNISERIAKNWPFVNVVGIDGSKEMLNEAENRLSRNLSKNLSYQLIEINSIAKGQHEVSESLGMDFWKKMRFVILPQAIKVVLPALGNQFVYVLKMSSLVSIIGIADLTRKANELVTTTYRPLEIYTFLILEYLVLILIVSYYVRKLENRLKYK